MARGKLIRMGRVIARLRSSSRRSRRNDRRQVSHNSFSSIVGRISRDYLRRFCPYLSNTFATLSLPHKENACCLSTLGSMSFRCPLAGLDMSSMLQDILLMEGGRAERQRNARATRFFSFLPLSIVVIELKKQTSS